MIGLFSFGKAISTVPDCLFYIKAFVPYLNKDTSFITECVVSNAKRWKYILKIEHSLFFKFKKKVFSGRLKIQHLKLHLTSPIQE